MESQTVNPITVPETTIVDRDTWNKLKSCMPKLHHSCFPEKFFWGAASASYQYEGAVDEDGRGPSIWDTFTQNHPEKLHGRSNGKVASDFYHKYKDDVKLMKEMGLNAFRFSISWSRVLPKGSLCGGVNKEGIKFYNDLIKEIKANGMEPFVTLYHWDLPQGLEDEYHGFLSTKVVKDYVDYAELCFKEFGDDVKYWITFNESWTFCSSGYAIGTHAPGRSSANLDIDDIKRYLPSSRCSNWRKHKCIGGDSGTEPYIVAHNQILAHAEAVKLYKEKYQAKQCGVIGMTMNCNWMIPMTETKKDQDAAQRGLDWMFGWFMHPLTYGEYPTSMQKLVGCRLPKFSDEEVELVKGSYDFLGLNYYTANYCVDAPDEAGDKGPNYVTDDQVIQTPEKDGVLIGLVAGSPWLHVYPQGIKDLLLYIKNNYNDPLIYITENGIDELNTADTNPEEHKFDLFHQEKLYVDQMRILYHYEHLMKVKEAIEEGVNVKGYFAWSFLDNFEWAEGYSVRFGIYHVDYNSGQRRHPKLSTEWFKSLLHN